MNKILVVFCLAVLTSCSKADQDQIAESLDNYPAIKAAFGDRIDLAQLVDYAGQAKPTYITKDNARGTVINNAKATLGRVLFYDKNLSVNNTVSCGSCHKQSFAFSDTATLSNGVEGGVTGRHSMRLVNIRFANEAKMFWNERAVNLQAQVIQPIQDHAEMGFSGEEGRPDFAALRSKLQSIEYYKELFRAVYGDEQVTEGRIQEGLTHFVLSIQSFDSKYDMGRAAAPNDAAPFNNFTAQENQGKQLYLTPPVFDGSGSRIAGGLGCNGCHNAPEFDIDPNTGNNGIIGIVNKSGIDVANTRAPSLRDLVKADGTVNGPMMHTGIFTTLKQAIGHYGTINIAPGNAATLDQRLRPGGVGQQLNLTVDEVNALQAFLRTLAGVKIYSDARWSNPFL